MTEPNATRFIITGGTLSSFRNTKGRLVPSEEALRAQLDLLQIKNYDIETPPPYVIDSIDLDMKEHGPKLLACVRKALKEGRIPIVCGGTDSKIWYSTLVTKQLQQEGFLKPGSGQKVIFVSSILSLEDDAQHVRRLLACAEKLASEPALSGGFAVSAENKQADSIAVHNVCDHFDKISSHLVYPFRSGAPLGYYIGGQWHPNKVEDVAAVSPRTGHGLSRIAPPLLPGQDSEVIYNYLSLVGRPDSGFDGAIIEGSPAKLYHSHRTALPALIRDLTTHGFRVVFNNNLHYDHLHRIAPSVKRASWGRFSTGSFYGAEVEYNTGLPKDTYLDMMISGRHAEHAALPVLPVPRRKVPAFKLRYVPQEDIMRPAIEACTPHTKSFVLSALPNGVMPDYMYDSIIAAHQQGRKIYSTNEYTGRIYSRDGTGEDFIESPKRNPYESGNKLEGIVKMIGVGNPLLAESRSVP